MIQCPKDMKYIGWKKHSLSCRFLRSNFLINRKEISILLKLVLNRSWVSSWMLGSCNRSLFSFILSQLFIKLQVKEFRIMALSINDSIYSCLFFFLTGLHFFHLTIGIFLLSLFFWSCSFSSSLLFSIEKECIFWN